MRIVLLHATLAMLVAQVGNAFAQENNSLRTTVLVNATVLSVDDQFSEHEALAIRGNKILAVGSLEPGKLADFVVLDGDPRKVAPTKISQIKVLETWIDGKKVYPGDEEGSH